MPKLTKSSQHRGDTLVRLRPFSSERIKRNTINFCSLVTMVRLCSFLRFSGKRLYFRISKVTGLTSIHFDHFLCDTPRQTSSLEFAVHSYIRPSFDKYQSFCAINLARSRKGWDLTWNQKIVNCLHR